MPVDRINGVGIYWEMTGEPRETIVLVHGSWGDHTTWNLVVPALAQRWCVVTYDRRGHSRSERPRGQGTIREDVLDLAGVIEHLGLGPSHIVGNSFGGAIALRLAADRPELFRTLVVHEPPLFRLLEGSPGFELAMQRLDESIAPVIERLRRGDLEGGAQRFVEDVGFGPGAWSWLPEPVKAVFVHNAPTWLDEIDDPESFGANVDGLARFDRPALLSHGDETASFFPPVVERLTAAMPRAEKVVLHGAGHVPHVSHSEAFVRVVTEFIGRAGRLRAA